MELTKVQEKLLKQIKEKEKPTASKLHSLEQFEDNYTIETIRNKLRIIRDEYELIQNESNRPIVYGLTDKGIEKLNSLEKEERVKKLRDKDQIHYRDLRMELEEFFEEYYPESIGEVELGNSKFEFSYRDLEKFNPDLADRMKTNSKRFFDACDDAVFELTNQSDYDVRITDLPNIDTKSIPDISTSDIGDFVSVEGIIQSVGDQKPVLSRGVFVCEGCGDQYVREADNGKVRSPYKCDCDSRKFELKEKSFKNYRALKLKTKPDTTGKDTIRVEFSGNLADDLGEVIESNGLGVKIYGYLIAQSKNTRGGGNSKEHFYKLQANNYEVLETKWSDIDIESKDIERIKEIKEDYSFDEWVKLVRNSLAKDVVDAGKMGLMKESVLNYVLGKYKDENLHVMVIGDPGLAKSQIVEWINDTMPKTVKSLGTGSSGVGLTASVKRDEFSGDYVLEAGAIPMANNGFHLTDEVDKLDDNELVSTNEALSENTISINKAGINTSLPASVSEYAIGNPKDSVFDPYDSLVDQIPIDKSEFLRRFDLKIALKRDDISKDEHLLVADANLDNLDDRDLIDDELLVKFMVHSQSNKPKLSGEVKQKIKELYYKLQTCEAVDSKDENRTHFIDPTRIKTLKLLSVSYARLDLSSTVEIKHLKRANKMFRECLETFDIELGKDSTDQFNLDLRESNRIKKFNELLDSEFVLDDGLEFSEVVGVYKDQNSELDGLSDSEIENKVKELCDKSDEYYLDGGELRSKA